MASKRGERKYHHSKKRKLVWIAISVSVAVLALAVLAIVFLPGVPKPDNSVIYPANLNGSYLNITDTLPPGYASYLPFVDHNYTTDLNLTFRSSLPIDVYYVPTDKDYENFMINQNFKTYNGCLFENKTEGNINCLIKTGGIIIYNPNTKDAYFSILG